MCVRERVQQVLCCFAWLPAREDGAKWLKALKGFVGVGQLPAEMGTGRLLAPWFRVVHQRRLAVLSLEALPSIIAAGDVTLKKSALGCFGEKRLLWVRGTFSGILGKD